MWRTVTAAVGAAILGFAMMGTALAWPERFEGRPEQFEAGGDSAYYIWHADDGVHLSTTGPGPKREFRAVIHTDGEFEDIDQVRLDDADSYELQDGGKTLIVRFDTWGHTDNIRWRIKDREWMHFNLNVDGHDIGHNNIYLGAEGIHPPRSEFRVHR